MNKEIKNSIKIISEKENQRSEAKGKAEADLKEYRSSLLDLRERLKQAEADPDMDPEAYKILVREMRDTEAVIQFCENRVRMADNISLTDEEYSSIIKETKTAYEGMTADAKKAVYAEVDKLVKILSDYNDGVQELNNILTSAGNLNKRTPIVLRSDNVGVTNTDNMTDPYRYFINAFSQWKGAITIQDHYKNVNRS